MIKTLEFSLQPIMLSLKMSDFDNDFLLNNRVFIENSKFHRTLDFNYLNQEKSLEIDFRTKKK